MAVNFVPLPFSCDIPTQRYQLSLARDRRVLSNPWDKNHLTTYPQSKLRMLMIFR